MLNCNSAELVYLLEAIQVSNGCVPDQCKVDLINKVSKELVAVRQEESFIDQMRHVVDAAKK